MRCKRDMRYDLNISHRNDWLHIAELMQLISLSEIRMLKLMWDVEAKIVLNPT